MAIFRAPFKIKAAIDKQKKKEHPEEDYNAKTTHFVKVLDGGRAKN